MSWAVVLPHPCARAGHSHKGPPGAQGLLTSARLRWEVKAFPELTGEAGVPFWPAPYHGHSALAAKVYGSPQPGGELVAVGDADTTQYCCWQKANLSKTQICIAFGEKEDAYECQEKWHCQIDGKLSAKIHICRWKGKWVQREKSPVAGERQWQGSSAAYPQAGELTSAPERQFPGCKFWISEQLGQEFARQREG